MLNRVFKELRLDYKTEAARASTLRKKEKVFNNTITGVNADRDMKNFN